MTDNTLWFTRVTLRRDAPDVAPLIRRLLPDHGDDGERLNATHQLLWTLMPQTMQQAGKPGQPEGGGDKAAFLWREAEQANTWYMLGPKPREDSSFLAVDAPKHYALSLEPGDRLSFDMVVHATVNRLVEPEKGRDGRKRCDVVLDALKAQERSGELPATRAARRFSAATEALSAWMSRQGAGCGFALDAFDLVAYRTVALDRPTASRKAGRAFAKAPHIGVGHVRGILTVGDPASFAAKVMGGFGRAKAFGCGLMLLRRVDQP